MKTILLCLTFRKVVFISSFRFLILVPFNQQTNDDTTNSYNRKTAQENERNINKENSKTYQEQE